MATSDDRLVGSLWWDPVSSQEMIQTDFGPKQFEHGANVTIADYPELYAVLGKTFGGDDTTFRLPDYRGRVVRDDES